MTDEPAHLRDLLEWRRGGDHGRVAPVPFDRAWEQAVAAVCKDSPEGDFWRGVFAEQEDIWRRAYDREPPEHGDAPALLDPARTEPVSADELAALVTPEPLRRRCALCGGSMEGRSAQAKYCRPEHEREAACVRRRAERKAAHCTRPDGELSHPTRESSRFGVAA
jgi:hypothetical protein